MMGQYRIWCYRLSKRTNGAPSAPLAELGPGRWGSAGPSVLAIRVVGTQGTLYAPDTLRKLDRSVGVSDQ
jgi:hypothetical protein